mgnify:CR=1 FL=1
MKAHLRILLVGIIACLGQVASAQSLIFYENTRSEAYLVKLNGGGPSQGITNHFIEQIANGSNKAANNTEYILTADESVRLTKVNPQQYDVKVTLGNFRFSGDTQYRAFQMQEFLRPTAVKFTLERVNKAGQVLERFPFEEVALNGEPTLIANFRGTDSTGLFQDCSVRIADKQFIIDKIARGNFDQRTILIDDCYNGVPSLEALYTDFRTINPGDFEHIDVQQRNLDELVVRLNRIGSVDYPTVLGLAQADPVGYLRRFQENTAFAQQLQTQIDQTRSEIPQRYYQRGLAFLEATNPAAAKADFTKAIRLSPRYGAPHLELARMSYREGDIKAAQTKLIYIAKECPADGQTAQGLPTLSNTIYLNHIGNADYANKQKQFPKALVALDEASEMCNNLPIECSAALEAQTKLAHVGIFQSKIDTARLALSQGQLEKAEAKAGEAIAYQKKRPAYIPLADAAVAVERDAQTRIYQRFLIQANALAGQGKLVEAETEAKNAIAYQAAHSANIPSPSAGQGVLNKIMDLRYLDLINRGMAQNQAKSHRAALDLFQEALDIEAKFPVTKSPSLMKMAQDNAKPLALAMVPEGLQLAKSNKLPASREVNNDFKALVERYQIGGDAEIATGTQSLRDAIFSQECANAQGDFDGAMNGAVTQIRLKRFIEANDAYVQALQIAVDQAQCGIDVTEAHKGKADIADAVKFQQLLLSSQTAIDRAEHKVAIDTYDQASEVFESKGLASKFGLEHASLREYILGSGRNQFVRYGSDYMTAIGDLDGGLALIHKAASMGVSKKSLKPIMIRLGIELAKRDASAGMTADPKAKGLEYSQGKKLLKKLYKSYVKQRKRLSK